jgi:hypothetical protein
MAALEAGKLFPVAVDAGRLGIPRGSRCLGAPCESWEGKAPPVAGDDEVTTVRKYKYEKTRYLWPPRRQMRHPRWL